MKRNRKLLSVIICMVVAFTVFPLIGENSYAMSGSGTVSNPYDVSNDISVDKSKTSSSRSLSACTGSFSGHTYISWKNQSSYTVKVYVNKSGYYQEGGYSVSGYSTMSSYSSGKTLTVQPGKYVWFALSTSVATSATMYLNLVTYKCLYCDAVFYDETSAQPHNNSHTISEPYLACVSDIYHKATCMTCKNRGHNPACYEQPDEHTFNSVGICSRCGYDDGTGQVTPTVSLTSAYKPSSSTPKKASITFDTNTGEAYKYWPEGYKIYVDGKYTTTKSYAGTYSITVPYYGSHTVYVIPYAKDEYGNTVYGQKSNTKTIAFKRICKAKISQITKLSSGKACIHVTKPAGATGVRVYKGSKLIKTLTKSGHFKYSASGAGKAAYRTKAYITENSKKYYGYYSTSVRPKSNTRVISGQGNYSAKNSFNYATAHFKIAKVYYSKGRLKVAGYVYNTRIFDLKSIKVKVRVNAEGKTYSKTFYKTVRMGEYGKKYITLSFPKSYTYDLRGASLNSSCYGNWGFGYEE